MLFSLSIQVLDDFADCVSDFSDPDSSVAAPSLANVYELSCAFSPASSVDTAFSAEFGRTSPLCHYPLSSGEEVMGASCFAEAMSACAADVKPLLRKVS